MIGRVRERAQFERIVRHGSRARGGALWCTFVLDPLVLPPAVAFAITRSTGPAVVRNRVRRRLRALLHEPDNALPPGLFLFGLSARTGAPSYSELARSLTATVTAIRTSCPPLPTPRPRHGA